MLISMIFVDVVLLFVTIMSYRRINNNNLKTSKRFHCFTCCTLPPSLPPRGGGRGEGGQAVDSTHPDASSDTKCGVIVLKTATLSAWLKKFDAAIETHV